MTRCLSVPSVLPSTPLLMVGSENPPVRFSPYAPPKVSNRPMMGLANSMAVSSLRQNPPTCCELALIFSRGPLRAELWSQVLHHPVTPMRRSPPFIPHSNWAPAPLLQRTRVVIASSKTKFSRLSTSEERRCSKLIRVRKTKISA